MDGSLCRMTPAQAQTAESSGRITRLGCGWAEATPNEQNGHDGYFLLRMETILQGGTSTESDFVSGEEVRLPG